MSYNEITGAKLQSKMYSEEAAKEHERIFGVKEPKPRWEPPALTPEQLADIEKVKEKYKIK